MPAASPDSPAPRWWRARRRYRGGFLIGAALGAPAGALIGAVVGVEEGEAITPARLRTLHVSPAGITIHIAVP